MCSKARCLALFGAEAGARAPSAGQVRALVAPCCKALLLDEHGIAHELTLALEGQLAQGVVFLYLVLEADEEVLVITDGSRHHDFYSNILRVVL